MYLIGISTFGLRLLKIYIYLVIRHFVTVLYLNHITLLLVENRFDQVNVKANVFFLIFKVVR